jgi:hypothetical protein
MQNFFEEAKKSIRNEVIRSCKLPKAFASMEDYAEHFAECAIAKINDGDSRYEISGRYTLNGNPVIVLL